MVVFFALTRKGFDDLVTELGRVPSPLWVNKGVLSEIETRTHRESGVELTNFTYDVLPNDIDSVNTAVHTMIEHHPDHSVWIEHSGDRDVSLR
jgi:hypothetical protein